MFSTNIVFTVRSHMTRCIFLSLTNWPSGKMGEGKGSRIHEEGIPT